jgi:hypothetical protein
MNQQIERVKSTLREEFLTNNELENPLERLNGATKIVETTISDFKKFIEDHRFENNTEEIEFFKIIKPEVLAHKIEEVIKYNLLINKPIDTSELQTKYYEEQLNGFQGFFRLNSFHYQYYKNGLTELDTLFFLRSSGPLSIPLADNPETDKEFSTPMSYLFAKFIAYECVQYFILEQLAALKYPGINLLKKSGDGIEDLKWTGDAINIVELAYGLWLTGQLNNGNASLNQIVRWLETNLHVSIGIVQRRFAEIGRRKRLSVTKFIDQMRDKIRKKIENDQE